jgi:hypothetical protein
MDLDETILRLLLWALALIALIGLLPAMFRVFRIHHVEVRHGSPHEEPPPHG